MTNTPDNFNQQTDASSPRNWRRIVIISGLGLGTVSVAGGAVGTWWFQEKLAPMVSENLTRLTQRPIKVGELQKFRIGYLEFGPSSLPPTSTDSIAASTEVVKVRYALGPLLFRTLKLDITFGKSQANLQQQADGSFKIPELADLPPPPFNTDITALRFPELDVTILPAETGKSSDSILLDLSNSEVFSKDKLQRWIVDLNGKVIDGGGNFQLDADANLKNSEIKADVVAQKLQLPIFAPLALAFENIPDISLQSGELNANLRTQIKLTDKIADLVQNIQGKVSLQGLKANSSLLSDTVNLNTVANVAWPKVTVENLNANYGNIGLNLEGTAQTTADFNPQNLNLNLNATVLPVTFDTLFNTAITQINLLSQQIETAETKQQLQQIRSQIQNIRPLLDGGVKTNFNIVGSLLQPVISGKVETTEVTRVDRLSFQDIATNFTINPQLNQEFQPLNLTAGFSDLQISPVVGGKITGKGAVVVEELGEVGIQESGVKQEQETNFNPVVDLNLKVENLPVEPIAQQYGFTSPLPLGDFSTEVAIAGALESLKGQVQWKLPKAVYPVSGTVDIVNSQANIKNTVVEVGGGKVNIDGNANLDNWQLNVNVNQINLNNLEPLKPLGLPSGLEGIVNAQANSSGLTRDFSINTIDGNGSGTLNIAGGQVNFNARANNGNLQGKGNAVQLSLSALERIGRNANFLTTPNPILSSQTDGKVNGEATFSANLNDLSLAGITSGFQGNVNLANGTVNANGKVNNGRFQALVDTEELPLNPLLDLGLSAVNYGIITDQEQLNNIRANIPRLKTLNGKLNGQVNLSGNLANPSPENIAGDLVGNLKIDEGTINATGSLNSGNFQTTVKTDQISLTALEKLLTEAQIVSLKSNVLPTDTKGNIQGGATVSGNINNLTPTGIAIDGDGKVIIAGGTVNATGKLNNGNFQASVNSSKLAVNPLLDLGEAVLTSGLIPVEPNQIKTLQTQIPAIKTLNSQVNVNANLSGNLNNLSPEAITANTNSQLFIDGNAINIDGRLERGNFFANVEAENIALRPLEETVRKTGLIDIPATVTLPPEIEGEIFGNLSVFGNLNNLNPQAIAADGTGKLIIGNNTINATGKLDNGNFNALAIAEPIPLSFVKNIAKQIGVVPPEALPYLDTINGNILGSAEVAGNLENLNPEAIAAEAEGKVLLVDGGAVNITGELVGQKWQAAVVGDQIPLEQFSAALEKQEQTKPAVAAIRQVQKLLGQAENLPVIGGFLNTNIDLSGTLANLSPEAIAAQAKLTLSELPVIEQPLNSLFNWNGKQVEIEKVSIPPAVNANGVVGVDFPQQKPPTISGININVNLSDFDLESLPIEKLAQDLPIEKRGELLTGIVNFDGKVIGKSIEDLNLVGDVVLRNLAVNAVDFDSVLSGKLNAGIADGVTFKIAGEQDRLELVLDETYVPTAFLIQRDEAKLAGVTEGKNLLVTLDQFPVELLGIAPAAQFDIGPVSGEASAQIAISGLRTFDLNSITANGNLSVAKPSIGYIDAESFNADINFAEGIGTLNDGTLLLGESRYVLQAMVDINSPNGSFDPKFAGNLKIEKGEAQDILTALQWFNIEDIARGIATPNYANAEDVQPVAVGFPENTPVISQLRRFAEIQALLKQQLESQQLNGPIPIPPLADLDVTFSGEVVAEGSLQSGIDGKFDINGRDWTWGPYKVDKFLVQGQYENEVLTVEPLEVQLGEALLAFNGDLSPENQTGKLRLENIDLGEIQKFAQNYIPPNINVNITGILNAETEIGGNFEDPRAIGEINIVDGILNETPIEKAQTEFSYSAGRLRFGGGLSIIGDPILYRGDVPIDLPFAQVSAGSDLINVSVNIKNDALQIVNILTDQVTLNSGQGDILLQVKGTLQQPQAEGYAKFAGISITSAAFPQPLTDLEGTVLFQGDRIDVKNLQGIISDGKVEVIGVLPLLDPLDSQDPDINNPLTITLDQLNVDFQRVFQAGLDGQVTVKGAALQPEIGGQVEVSEGKIFLNQLAGLAASAGEEENAPAFGMGEFEVGLNNFQVTLSDRLRMISPGIANFEVAGGLLINGTLSDIRPSGMIDLATGSINLFTTELRLDPNYKNTATFTPINGLDPIVDVQLLASAFETNRSSSPSSPLSSETIDAPSPGTLNTSQRVRIMATAKGPLSELENNLELTSSPRRSEVQIVSLLGGNIIDTLSEDRSLALANVASTTILANLQQDVIAATGLSEFRIFPASIPKRGARRASSLGWGLEVGVDVTNKLGVSMTRLFGANEPSEFSLRYELNDEVRIRGGSNFNDNAVLSVEYEVQF